MGEWSLDRMPALWTLEFFSEKYYLPKMWQGYGEIAQ